MRWIMNTQKCVKMILYKISLEYDINLTTVEKYTNGEYKRIIILNIDNEKEYFNNYYELLDFLQGYIQEGDNLGRTKLTDKLRKKIIADYTEIGSYNEVARLNGVARNTVKNVVLKNEDTARLCQEKKEKNTQDILEYMDSKVDKQREIIDLALDVLKEKLENPDLLTNIKDVATVYGVIIDKALKYKELQVKSGDNDRNNFADSLVELWKEREKHEK